MGIMNYLKILCITNALEFILTHQMIDLNNSTHLRGRQLNNETVHPLPRGRMGGGRYSNVVVLDHFGTIPLISSLKVVPRSWLTWKFRSAFTSNSL